MVEVAFSKDATAGKTALSVKQSVKSAMMHMVPNSTVEVKVKSKTEIGLVLSSVDDVESTKAALCNGVANCVAVLHSGGRRRLSESGTFSATFLVTIVHDDSESVDSTALEAAVASRVPIGATVSTQATSSTTTEVTVVSTGTKSDADTLISDTLSQQSVADSVATEMGIDASQITVSTPLASFPPPMPPPTVTLDDDDDDDDDNTMQIVLIASIAVISVLAIALTIYLMMRQRKAQREESAFLLASNNYKKTDMKPAQQLASASGLHFVLPSVRRY